MTGQAAGSSRTPTVDASTERQLEEALNPLRGSGSMPGLSLGAMRKIRKKYGMQPDEYLQLHAEQGGVCAICRMPDAGFNPDGSPRRLAVDHDHATGAIRGLLCVNCNLVLAHAKDRIDLLLAATDYLASPPRLLADRVSTAYGRHNRNKTHCKRGHEFAPENTLRTRRSWGTERVCRLCKRAREAA